MLPLLTSLVTLMSPPITPASSRLMVSPSPVPVCGCDTPSAPRSNGAKMRSRSLAWIRGPVSITSNSATGLR